MDSVVLSLSTATAHAREPIRHQACSLQRPRTARYAYRRRSRQHATAVPAALTVRAHRDALAQLLFARHAVRAVGAHGAMIDAPGNPIIMWPRRRPWISSMRRPQGFGR